MNTTFSHFQMEVEFVCPMNLTNKIIKQPVEYTTKLLMFQPLRIANVKPPFNCNKVWRVASTTVRIKLPPPFQIAVRLELRDSVFCFQSLT